MEGTGGGTAHSSPRPGTVQHTTHRIGKPDWKPRVLTYRKSSAAECQTTGRLGIPVGVPTSMHVSESTGI
ncbi:unnamed protein product [Pleuronectes platessa]|uniref:Uncharacterized protein n=1 Tax=Pleuronectes platessa TaxID=8262 RepID=A0A9N7TRS2_PLEPL|nr:unnamed protein product [Pleuronectes platessa]